MECSLYFSLVYFFSFLGISVWIDILFENTLHLFFSVQLFRTMTSVFVYWFRREKGWKKKTLLCQ